MRFSLFAACVLVGVAWAPSSVRAQSDAAPGGATSSSDAARQRAIGFLPQAEQDRVTSVYDKAMGDHPKLKSEGDAIKQEGMGMRDASEKDRQAFMEKARSYREKVRRAMLKEDSSIAPILDKIDKHMSEMWAEHQKEMNGGGGSGQ